MVSLSEHDINVFDEKNIRASYLTVEDLKVASSLLYQSYHEDPVFMDIFDINKGDYEQRLRAVIKEELNAFWYAKQPMIGLFLNESMIGVICLNSPDDSVNSKRFWHWRLKMLLSAGYFGTKQMIEKEQIIKQAIPLSSYHMLSFIAVHPLHQKNGYGQYLIAAMNSVVQAHSDSEGIAIFATNPHYQKYLLLMGYKNLKDLTIGNVSGQLMIHYIDTQ